MMVDPIASVEHHDAVDRILTLLRAAPESQFAPLTVLARELLGTSMAAINIAQGDIMWSRMASGFAPEPGPKDDWICQYAVARDEPLTVEDCIADPRFADLPSVIGTGMRFYAGVPLHATDPTTGTRRAIGTICVADPEPRAMPPAKLEALRALGDLTETVIATHMSVGVAVDIATYANRQAKELARQQRLFGHAERMAMIGSWWLGLPDNEVHWSPGIRRIHDLPADASLPLEEALSFYPPHARAIVTATLAQSIETGQPFDFEVDFITATGRLRRVRSLGEVEQGPHGVSALAGVFQDVTDRYLVEQQLRRSATTDPLTGIANRAAFDIELERAIEDAVAGRGGCVLVLIDLDHFKAVNDTHGHLAGDEVLRVAAQRLGAPYLSRGFAARLGGDEFALILHDRGDCDQADLLAARLSGDLARDAPHEGGALAMSATLGYAMLGDGIADARGLLNAADGALYAAKRRRRGSARRHGADLTRAS